MTVAASLGNVELDRHLGKEPAQRLGGEPGGGIETQPVSTRRQATRASEVRDSSVGIGHPRAEGVGRSTTGAVVASSVLILLLDVLLAQILLK